MSDNIVGKDHLDYVKNQITTRQEILGKSNRDSEDIVWMDGRDSWVRLMSSIDIESQFVIRENEDVLVTNNGAPFRNQYLNLEGYAGPQLAQENILQSGLMNSDQLRFGVADILSESPNTLDNYGFAAEDGQRGLLPMPGLTGFSLKTYNKGSLRKASLQITAHNSQQFKYIESLYLRLGYTMLLEWGNTKYPIKNEDGSTRYSTESDIASLSLKNEFFNVNKGTSYFYTRIEELRNQSQGNYDAFLGKVTNFSWEFTKSGSYLINLDLISIGSVVESLKLNTNVDNIKYTTPNTLSTPEEDRPSALEVAIDLLASTQTSFKEKDASILVENTQAVSSLPTKTELNLAITTSELNPEGYVMSCNASYGGSGVQGSSDNVYDNKSYLRLGTLLNFINKKLLIYDKNSNPALIEIDTNIDNYCYSNGWSFSGDPTKMVNKLFKNYNLWSSTTTGDPDLNVFPLIEDFHDTLSDGTPVGRIMNLYFEREYLKSIIKRNLDEDENLFLFDFIKSILNTANSLLGGVNKLNLRIVDKSFTKTENGTTSEYVKQVLEIYDEVRSKKIDTQPVFNVFGFNPNNSKSLTDNSGSISEVLYNGGSFVTDFNIKTEITKNLSTQISIGAQASGRAVGEDATIFSKWNIGLVDRVIPYKLDIYKSRQANFQSQVDFIKLRKTYLEFLKKLYNTKTERLINDPSSGDKRNTGAKTIITTAYTFPDVYLNSTSDDKPVFLKFQQIQKQFFSKVLSYDAERKDIGNPFIGFIPVKFNMTMDGLSGIRIFDKLTIDSRFLPSNYTDTLDFIITEVDHKVEGNKWITSLGTLSMPKLFDKSAEVLVEDVILDNSDIEENRIYDNSSEYPSYFYIKQEVVVGMRKGTNGKRIEIDELLTYLNDSPYVQTKFKKFFDNLLEVYDKGYQFTINSIVRKLDTATGVGLSSEHIWGLSIDMAVREARPDGGFSSNILYGLEQTPEGAKKWNDKGFSKLALGAGLRWGGTWTTGSWKYDTVHFGAIPGWGNVNTIPTNLLFGLYPRLKTLIQESIDGTEKNASNIISGLDLTNFLDIKEKDGDLVITVDTSRDGELAILNGIRFIRANGGQIINENLIK